MSRVSVPTRGKKCDSVVHSETLFQNISFPVSQEDSPKNRDKWL